MADNSECDDSQVDVYSNSTQCRYWVFSASQLSETRAAALQRFLQQTPSYSGNSGTASSPMVSVSSGGFSLTPLTGTGDTAAAATPTTRLLGDLSLVTPKSVPTATSSASTTGTKRKRGTETDAAAPTPKISALTSASGPLRARFEDTEATSISDTISLSPAQIDRMMLHFERRAHQAALMAGLSVDAAATCVIFLKRFYVHRHFAELSPELIWGSCVLVANKAEETKILPQHVAKKMGIPLASVVQFEIAVLDALRFHLQVFHPYRSLKAFFQLIKENAASESQVETDKMPANVVADIVKLQTECINLITFVALHSDAPLLFSPAQIALAAIAVLQRHSNVPEHELFHVMTFGPPSVPADASDVEREQTLSQFASLQTRIESCVTLLTNRAQDIGYSIGDSSLAIPELDQHTLAVLSRLCTIHEQRQESLRSEKFDEAQRRQKNAFAGEGTAHILEKQAANVASLLGHDLITGASGGDDDDILMGRMKVRRVDTPDSD